VTTIPFLPNNASSPPFQATVTLDGISYSLIAMWNLYRPGWYISLADQNGNLVLNQPLIGSPPGRDIPLAPGLFTTSTFLYRVSTGNFEIGP
jgi:hypothetical protein